MGERVKAPVKESGKSSSAPQRDKASFEPRGFAVQPQVTAEPAGEQGSENLLDAYLETEARLEAAGETGAEVGEVLQGRLAGSDGPTRLRDAGEAAEHRTGMPEGSKVGLEQLGGFDLPDVPVHYNSARAQAPALAVAQGPGLSAAPPLAIQQQEVAIPAAEQGPRDILDADFETETRLEAARETGTGAEVGDVLQGRFAGSGMPMQLRGTGEAVENRTGMPEGLKEGLEQLGGFDLSGVRVHYNSPKPAQVQALAYTQGRDIHVAPGQERHLPHEGWHVVQQMEGRVKPTLKSHGVAINDDAGLEREADVMGVKALQMRRANQGAADRGGTAGGDAGVAQLRLQDREGVVRDGSSGKEYWRENGDYVTDILSAKDLAVPDNIIELLDALIADQMMEYSIPDLILNIKSKTKVRAAGDDGKAKGGKQKEPDIPPLLHFYWAGKDISAGEVESLNAWASGAKNSGWRIWLWYEGALPKAENGVELDGNIVAMRVTPQVIHEDLRGHYDYYIKNETASAAADLARYSIIKRYGGVYADLDEGPGAMDFSEALKVLDGGMPLELLDDSDSAELPAGAGPEAALEQKMIGEAVKKIRAAAKKQQEQGGKSSISTPKAVATIRAIISDISKSLGKLAEDGKLSGAGSTAGQLAVARAIRDKWEFVRSFHYGDEKGSEKMRRGEVFERYWKAWLVNLPLEWVTPENDG